MDEMRLNLKTKFMRGVAAKLIAKMIYKKTGYKVDIQINDLDVWSLDGDTSLTLNVEAKMKSEDFNKAIKNIGLE